MTAHVLLKNEINKDEIIQLKKEIKEFLSNSNIEHATLEIEYPNEECSSTEC